MRSVWGPQACRVTADESLAVPATGDDLPPPGPERRRLLRAAGVNFTVEDFTEEERAERGWVVRRSLPQVTRAPCQ
jgi:hypothetical protein